jgi:predicted ATPase
MPHLTELNIHSSRFPEPDGYPFNVPAIKGTPKLDLTAPVTFFVGENGSGKSTILKAITRLAGIHMWEGERRRRSVRNRWAERLHEFASLTWRNGSVPGSWFSSESFRTFSETMDEFAAADPGFLKHMGGSSLITKSHGQSTMAWFAARFSREGLYLMDEPETALSPITQLSLVKFLASSRPDNAQFIIATHSPILLACPGAVIYNFDGETVERIDYDDTEHYRIYKEFMADRDKFLE